MLQIKGFRKSYHENVILDVPDLVIGKGVIIFQGHNGSGKSTFLKAISGMIPFEGEVVLDNEYFLSKPVIFRKWVNYSAAEPQYPILFPERRLSTFTLKLRLGKKSEIEEYVKQLHVNSFYKNPIGSYSSGMLKKIWLNRRPLWRSKNPRIGRASDHN